MKTRLLTVFLIALSACAGRTGDAGRIQLLLDWKAQMEHAGFFVATAKGHYAAEGLTVEILDGNGAPTTAQLVGNGTYKLGVSSGSATVMARVRGIPVKSLAVINQHSPTVVYSLRDSGLTRPEHLPGKRIGVNIGGTKHREFQAFLKKAGMSEDAVTLMGMTESSPAPLLAGQVDAMLGYTEDQPVTVELRGHAVNRIAVADYGVDLYSTNVIVNETFLREHPDIVHRFVRASMRGWADAVAHPEDAVNAYLAVRPESDRAFCEANFRQLIPILQSPDVAEAGIGAQTSSRWSHTQDVLFDLGLIESKAPVADLFTNDFILKP